MGKILIAQLLMLLITIVQLSYAQYRICSNPQSYSGQVLADHLGTYRGQCVSFVKVSLNSLLKYYVIVKNLKFDS